jgi:type II secretory pathway pseudopilin PulG
MTVENPRAASVPGERSSEAGFTLVEALIAMVILMVGLAAVSNLMIVSATSNTAANLSTASTAAATSQMEVLKSQSFQTLTPGGNFASPVASYNTAAVPVTGVGKVDVRWQIVQPPNPLTNVRFIQIRSQMGGRLGSGWSRADFTTFRACTDGTGVVPGC